MSVFSTLTLEEALSRKTLALQSLARELSAAADVVRDGGMPESGRLLRMISQRAMDAAMISAGDDK